MQIKIINHYILRLILKNGQMNQTKRNRIYSKNYYRNRTRKHNTYFELPTLPQNTVIKKPREKIYPTSHPVEEGLWDNWMG